MNETVHRNGAPDIASATRRVALAGNPNVGKTTIFNALTGMRQKVGNYPGVTVERKTGNMTARGIVEVIDLPGAYSLDPKSQDEAVVSDVLSGRIEGEEIPDLVVCIVDAGNLERNLYLVTQIIDLGIPVLLVLNMLDMADERGLEIDTVQLMEELGIPVIPMTANRNKGFRELRAAIMGPLPGIGNRKWELMPAMREPVSKLAAELGALRPNWNASRLFSEALRAVTSDAFLEWWRDRESAFHAHVTAVRKALDERKAPYRQAEIIGRYNWLASLVNRSVSRKNSGADPTPSDRIDAVLTHRFFGPLLFFAVLGLIFQSIFTWATPAMDGIEWLVGRLGETIRGNIPPGLLTDLVVDGAIAGVGNVLVFLPQIMLLFFFLGLMEDTGYMARTALIMDRMMRRVGLSGGSVVPLLSSYACAIPGIMAARTLDNERDRLITIMVAPLMSCSARLPVYTLFIAAFIPAGSLFGVFAYQGIAMFSLYIFGTVMAFVAAWVLRKFVFKQSESYFAIELPPYRLPQMKQVLWRMYDRSKAFITNAGGIIFAMSVTMWLLASFPRSDAPAEVLAMREQADQLLVQAEAEAAAQMESTPEDLRRNVTFQRVVDELAALEIGETAARLPSANLPAQQLAAAEQLVEARRATGRIRAEADDAAASHQVRNSLIGRFGRAIEPVMEPLGFDWKISAGIIAAFTAREVIISVLATIYSVGDANESSAMLRDQLRSDRDPETGRPVYTPLVAVSLLVFFVFALQCMSTLAIARKETNSWRWPAVMWLYMTALAYLFSLIIYQGGQALGLG